MWQNHERRLTRRDFLKLSAAALGGATLACGGGSKIVELTAVPSPVPSTTTAASVNSFL